MIEDMLSYFKALYYLRNKQK